MEFDHVIQHLVTQPSSSSVSDHLKKDLSLVKHCFQYSTTDATFLEQTQRFMACHDNNKSCDESIHEEPIDLHRVKRIVIEMRSMNLLQKYNYMDIEMLQECNRSNMFLQVNAVMNITSPLLTMMMPIVMIAIPFIQLQIQGVEISLDAYLSVLFNLFRNHMVSKVINSLLGVGAFSTLLTLIASFALFLYQSYRNYTYCRDFYNNMYTANENMIYLCKFLLHCNTLFQQDWAYLNDDVQPLHPAYAMFGARCFIYQKVSSNLIQLWSNLSPEKPDTSFFALTKQSLNMGEILKCYYMLFDNQDFSNTILYFVDYCAYNRCLSALAKSTIVNYRVLFVDETPREGSVEEESKEGSVEEQSEEGSVNREYGWSIQSALYPLLSTEETDKQVSNTLEWGAANINTVNNVIITGVNASGKTTVLKTIGLNVLFVQQFGCVLVSADQKASESVAARVHKNRLYNKIVSYLNIPDTSGRDSLFQAECRRCKEMLFAAETQSANRPCLFLLDELFSGTNPDDAVCASVSYLAYLHKLQNVDYILTTHFLQVVTSRLDDKKARALQMELFFSSEETFLPTFHVVNGVCSTKGGIKILQDMDFPKPMLEMCR